MPRSARHTMGGREVLDAKTMLDLLEGSASDGGPTVTIDVDVFKDNFGAPPPRRSSLSGGRRSSSSGASRRRETADPAQLKELLQACLLEGNDAAAAASPTSQPPRPAPQRSSCAADQSATRCLMPATAASTSLASSDAY